VRGWRQKARECKHSIEEARKGDIAVHMTRWKAIWMTHGNGVQLNAAVLIMVGLMRADEIRCGNSREVEMEVAGAGEGGGGVPRAVGLQCSNNKCTPSWAERAGSGQGG
jgi:hypothetical protein